ncbi:MAG: hypothetical protein V2I35_00190 [Desulfocapsaceae bacterium]|jgi:hypothetical protein|nr:hypothetical protein [Desulfocapsaceae bacterium]
MIRIIDFILKRHRQINAVLVTIIIAIFLWSFTVDTSHAHTWAEKHIPGFWSLFGIVSCIILIFTARWFSSAGISKGEDYYDD